MKSQSQIRLRSRRFKNIQCYSLLHSLKGINRIEIKTKFTTILAAGPNGIPAWDFLIEKIPLEDNTIIAVNYAVVFHEKFHNEYLKPDLWFVTDARAVGQIVPPETVPWFPDALARALVNNIKLCFNMKVVEKIWKELQIGGPYYTFISKKQMKAPDDVAPDRQVIRPGGTVTCSTAQAWDKLATHPERILLICGCDLSGDDYAIGKNTQKEHGETWHNSVKCLGGMIGYLNRKREQVFVISKTKLHDHGHAQFYPGSKDYVVDDNNVVDVDDENNKDQDRDQLILEEYLK